MFVNAFMGTLNLKTCVLCGSGYLNISIIEGLSFAGDFSFYYIDHPPTPICSQGYRNCRYKPLLPLWAFTACYSEHFTSPPDLNTYCVMCSSRRLQERL